MNRLSSQTSGSELTLNLIPMKNTYILNINFLKNENIIDLYFIPI